MAQIFHPSANTIARFSLLAVVVLIGLSGLVAYALNRSSYVNQVGVAPEQPVPFSHEHHVAGLGIDCRYCHATAETSDYAGMPTTHTCMTCHSQIWTNAELLRPVRESWAREVPIAWRRVYDLPDFVYFSHSIHVQKGVGCATCHGPVHNMPLTWKATSLQMTWCLDCHRNPENFIRPRDQVYNMDYTPAEPQQILGARLVKEYGIKAGPPAARADELLSTPNQLTNCSVCHR